MLNLQFPLPVKPICAFIYSEEKFYKKAETFIIKKLGEIDFISPIIDFNHTDYYRPEMGKPLFRRFISFKKLKDPSAFAGIKLFCIKIEKKLAKKGKRGVNIDPGYINEAKLVLTTTKDFSHRIYLNKGIYAEATLAFINGKFREHPATFPDYRTETYKDIFSNIRNLYRRQIHNETKN